MQVTFLPEGKTVQFEHGKLPYKDHGKPESLLDVALNNGIAGSPATVRRSVRMASSLSTSSAIDDRTAHTEVRAERAYLAALGGGCTLPCGALAAFDPAFRERDAFRHGRLFLVAG